MTLSQLEPGDRIANRYRVERLIGRGGAAVVYEVTDDQTGQRLAMKRLAMEDARRGQSWMLFQREYHTLSQLSHPLIIRAYDYGFDRGVPYYTMELLAGKDLRSVGSVRWREACSLARDVASALAIVHSRRLLHRDVSLRNVCRTEDGHGKLLDFGALTPMGPSQDIVGTPSFMAPESLQEVSLDGRADLFSLGACLYYLLTGRQAFPARRVSDLAEAWRGTPAPPSAFATDVPPKLDDLVLALLSLPAAARPGSAAEVFERLSAIADLATAEAPEVAWSYLLTPALVAREGAIDRFARRVTRAQRGRGGALCIEAESGLGRTRLLAALLLDAKLRGLLALRGAGSATDAQPFHVVAAMARALVRDEAELARDAAGSHAALLSPLLFPADAEDGPVTESWPRLAEAFTAFFVEVSKRTALVLGVDDFDACDDQSASVLLRLSSSAPSLPLIVVATCRREAKNPHVMRFRASAGALLLRPMTAEETRLLVSSVFGEVPNVEAVSRWVHQASEGSPRASLEIAQHFVDRGVAIYKDGSWSLPASPSELDLPANIGQALDRRVASLTPRARVLAETLSLTMDHAPLPFTLYGKLVGDAEDGVVFALLGELVAKGILIERGATYDFSHDEVKQAVCRAIPDGLPASLHARLADAYAAVPSGPRILVSFHHAEAGDMARAFAEGVASVLRDRIGNVHFGRTMINARLVDRLFEWGRENSAKPADLERLGRRVMQLASTRDSSLARHAGFLLARLQYDTGLDQWETYAGTPDPLERVRLCIGAAFARHDTTPEGERGLPPLEALSELTTSIGTLTGAYSRDLVPPKVHALVPILQPLRPLSPAIDVVAEVCSLSADSLSGQSVARRRLAVLERLRETLPGLDEDTRVGMFLTNLYYSVLEEAPLGRQGVEERVAPLDAYPAYAPLAWHARMIAHLFRGETDEADNARRRRDLATLGRADVDMHLEIGILFEGAVCELLDDLLGIKRALSLFEEKARTSPGWVSYRELYLGDYHHLRGEREKALEHYGNALECLRGEERYAAYVHACVRYVHALVEYDRPELAYDIATEGLGITERFKVPAGSKASIHLVLALAEAALGKGDSAVSRADAVISAIESSGTVGIVLVHHLGTRARIALRLGDRATFDAMAAKIGRLCVSTGGSSLSGKHARLLREATLTARFEAVASGASRLGGNDASHTTLASDLKTRFEKCAGAEERAELALRVVVDAAAASAGFLYLFREGELQLAAATAGELPSPGLEDDLAEWLAHLQNETTATITSAARSTRTQSSPFHIVELFAGKPSELVMVGIAALKGAADRVRPVPQDLLQALGDSLFEAGDATERQISAEVSAGAEL